MATEHDRDGPIPARGEPERGIPLREAPVPLEEPLPVLLVAADLADRGGFRELNAANELIRQALR